MSAKAPHISHSKVTNHHTMTGSGCTSGSLHTLCGRVPYERPMRFSSEPYFLKEILVLIFVFMFYVLYVFI